MQLQNILRGIRKADQDFGLIAPGDKIAVALSGGKDSMLLFLALSMYQKFSCTDFELCGIHIDVGFDQADNQEMIDFARQYHLELHIVKAPIFDILQQEENRGTDGKIQCSLCATLKKGRLFTKAKELGCRRIAFGHHGDDAVETLLLNMIHGAKIATFLPKQYMSRMDMYTIRPMVYLRESEIIQACQDNQVPSAKKICPNDGFTQRQEMKELLASIYRTYPGSQKAFIDSLSNLEQLRLWDGEELRKQQ